MHESDAPNVKLPVRLPGLDVKRFPDITYVPIQFPDRELKTGDTIHIKGHSTDFMQTVESMEYEHRHVDQASAGQSVGIKLKVHVRMHEIVYVVN